MSARTTQPPQGRRVSRAAGSKLSLSARRAALAQGAAAYGQRRDTALVRLLLPVPISVNAIYSPRKGGGLRLSDAYTAWIQEAGWRLEEQRPRRIAGRYQITMWVPEESSADLDNLIKAASDLLQMHGVVRNDRLASRIVLEWQREQAGASGSSRRSHPVRGGRMNPDAFIRTVVYLPTDLYRELERAATASGVSMPDTLRARLASSLTVPRPAIGTAPILDARGDRHA